jgi:hypothetical protein
VIALGGTSYAFTLGKNSVGTKQLKNSAVTTSKIKNSAVTTSKIKDGAVTGSKVNLGTLGTVPNASHATTADTATNANALGGAAPGTYQSAANIMFATVSSSATSPTILRGRGATAVTNLDGMGEYAVTFDRSIANCTWVASSGPGNGNPADAILAVVRARDLTNHPDDVQVNLFTSFADAETVGQGFHLVVLCP